MPEGEAAFNSLLRGYKSAAKRRGLKFELSREEFVALTKRSCYYCGVDPHTVYSAGHHYINGTYVYNGIDRIDNDKDYTSSNVVPCCFACNRAKMDTPYDDFICWLDRIAAFRGGDNGMGQKGSI